MTMEYKKGSMVGLLLLMGFLCGGGQTAAVSTCRPKEVNFTQSFTVCEAPYAGTGEIVLSREDSIKILEMYPGIFRAPTTWRRRRTFLKRAARRPRYVYSSCCSTTTYHDIVNITRDVYGARRKVVHLESIHMYQYTLKGRCTRCPKGYRCSVKQTSQFVAVWNTPFTNDKFPILFVPVLVPTYCYCAKRTLWRNNITRRT